MSDTPNDIAHALAERYRDRTPAERVRMAASLFTVATALARAGIRARNPEASEAEIRRLLLRRLYDGELTEAQFAEITRTTAP